jgi:hypothetical protein
MQKHSIRKERRRPCHPTLAPVARPQRCSSGLHPTPQALTFVRMHHPIHHLHRVIPLQLQGHIPHCIHQLCKEVSNLCTVLQEHVAVLAVGEVGVTQVRTTGRNKQVRTRAEVHNGMG